VRLREHRNQQKLCEAGKARTTTPATQMKALTLLSAMLTDK
jgi:hypothetical protein